MTIEEDTMFKYGKASQQRLTLVHPHLVVFADKLLKHTLYDISIISTARTIDEQKQIHKRGNSKIIKASRHIPFTPTATHYRNRTLKTIELKPWAHAFDYKVIDETGNGTWAIEYYYAVAEAAHYVCKRFDIPVTWGGCWKDLREIVSITSAIEDYKKWCKQQFKAGRRKNNRPFIDGGHFELTKAIYPQEVI